MPNSRPIKKIAKPMVIYGKKTNKPPAENIADAKPYMIFKNVWPDVLLRINE